MSLDYRTWAELAAAFVRVEAGRCGWCVRQIVRSRSGSVYVKLGHGSGARVRVRLSDHRAFGRGCREFHVRQAATLRLAELAAWLSRCGPGDPLRAAEPLRPG